MGEDHCCIVSVRLFRQSLPNPQNRLQYAIVCFILTTDLEKRRVLI